MCSAYRKHNVNVANLFGELATATLFCDDPRADCSRLRYMWHTLDDQPIVNSQFVRLTFPHLGFECFKSWTNDLPARRRLGAAVPPETSHHLELK